jgi:hypothetical protein
LKPYVDEFKNLTDSDRQDLVLKVNALLKAIDDEPKSTGWKMRSMVGAKKRWYNPVETSQTIGEFGIWDLRERK